MNSKIEFSKFISKSILAQSPVIGHLNTIISGLPVIRASKAEGVFQAQFTELQDRHSAIFYTSQGSTRWLCFTIELLSDFCIFVVLLYFLMSNAS